MSPFFRLAFLSCLALAGGLFVTLPARLARCDDASTDSASASRSEILQVLNRITFGPRPDDVEMVQKMGLQAYIEQQMTRGTFVNVRIKNLMVPSVEGGVTKHYPDGERMSIYDASMKYQKEGTPLVIIAGQEYGTGSSRDWAAKGTRLLGVKAVVAQSFERIHRSNLVGMGVLPLCFEDGTNAATLKLDGTETYSLKGLSDDIKPRQKVNLEIKRADGKVENVPLVLRIDTPIEVDYYQHGGILPYVLRQIVKKAA